MSDGLPSSLYYHKRDAMETPQSSATNPRPLGPMSRAVCLLVTGGTFDKEYDEIHGTLEFRKTHLPDMLTMARSRIDVRIQTLMMIDSLEMTDEDRGSILNHCRNAAERHIVITHGTDTMVETARLLADAALNKTIVLTGAMIPIAFGSSDGLFNLGGALTAVQVIPAGVYVIMNGCVFRWDNVQKNQRTGVFEAIGPD